LKKLNRKKKSIKLIKILKKLAGSIRFRFYKPKAEKNRTEPNPNRKNPETNRQKTEPNRKNRAKIEKTKPNRFETVFVLKNQTEPKPIGLNRFPFKKKKI
jgi:hypothetical protein